jgi:uncharacterized protein (TIGR00369 family)
LKPPVVRDPDFEARVKASFAKQLFMSTLGARLDAIVPGEVRIVVSHRPDLTQQHGFLHAGAVTSVVDSACGYAALTLMEPGAAVLSVEFKMNLLAPAAGREFIAIGKVVRAGRTVTVVSGELRSLDEGNDTVFAILQGTMMAVRDKPGLSD